MGTKYEVTTDGNIDGKTITLDGSQRTINFNSIEYTPQVMAVAQGPESFVMSSGFGTVSEGWLYNTRARGTQASPTVIQNGDGCGGVRVLAHNGTTHVGVSEIRTVADGVSGSILPVRMSFRTRDTSDGFVERLIIQNDGSVNFTKGITLPTTGASKGLLDFYATETFSMQFKSTIYASALVVNLTLIRVGGLVTITWPRATQSMSGGSASATIITNGSYHLPAAYRPSGNDIQFVLNGLDDDVITQLQGIITTTGQIRIGIAPNELNNFTFNGASSAGFYESSVSYFGEAT